MNTGNRPGTTRRSSGPTFAPATPRRVAWWTVAILLLAILVAGLWSLGGGQSIRGQLLDYGNGQPIAGATITITRRGWGRSEAHGQIVWDKAYRSTDTTGPDGRFATRLPGGIVRLGWYEDGTPFGWNFIDAAAAEVGIADLYLNHASLSPLRVILAVPAGGELHFVPAHMQGVATPSSNYLLRYLDEPPAQPGGDQVELDDTPGTLFVRTRHDRYAKLAWDPVQARVDSAVLPRR
jgi:hypothetical protein